MMMSGTIEEAYGNAEATKLNDFWMEGKMLRLVMGKPKRMSEEILYY